MGSNSSSSGPVGVHLVGSICGVPTPAASFQRCIAAFPNRLRRLPDGEPANRFDFIGWQREQVFGATPAMLEKYDANDNVVGRGERSSPDVVARVVQSLARPLKPGYDDYALASYKDFVRLREEGVVPHGTRFQVCVPTVYCVMSLLRAEYAAQVEPLYTEALLGCLKRIQEQIPAEDLAVQVDVAAETMLLMAPPGEIIYHFDKYWDGDAFTGCVDRIAALTGAVAPGVDVGLHICYGDMAHKHFIEPRDTADIVRITNAVAKKMGPGRPLDWVHFPVPKDRDDAAYYEPLTGLTTGPETELFVGLVHPNDEAGTRARLAQAEKVLAGKRWGVATECGLGRAPQDEFDTVAEISTAITEPISG